LCYFLLRVLRRSSLPSWQRRRWSATARKSELKERGEDGSGARVASQQTMDGCLDLPDSAYFPSFGGDRPDVENPEPWQCREGRLVCQSEKLTLVTRARVPMIATPENGPIVVLPRFPRCFCPGRSQESVECKFGQPAAEIHNIIPCKLFRRLLPWSPNGRGSY